VTIAVTGSGTVTVGGTATLGGKYGASGGEGSLSLAVTGSAAGTLSGTYTRNYNLNSGYIASDQMPVPTSCSDGSHRWTKWTEAREHDCSVTFTPGVRICQGWIAPAVHACCGLPGLEVEYDPVPGHDYFGAPLSDVSKNCEWEFNGSICQ